MMFFFFFNDTATTEIYTLSLHDALPTSCSRRTSTDPWARRRRRSPDSLEPRSEGRPGARRGRARDEPDRVQRRQCVAGTIGLGADRTDARRTNGVSAGGERDGVGASGAPAGEVPGQGPA